LLAVTQQSIDLTLHGSGVRDSVRVLGVSAATVSDVLKKTRPVITQVNARLLTCLEPAQLDVILRQGENAEVEERWSFVGSKSQPRWLGYAMDHQTGHG
jgi:hypothetical protein